LKVVSAIILAGGLGTRLRNTVPDLPKPMASVCGRPFLEHQLDYWIAQGIKRFVLSVGYRHEVIVDYFGSGYKGAELDYAIEKEPLGTGGGFLLAAKKLGSDAPFLLLNGDTYFAASLEVLTEFSLENDADWCFSLFPMNEKDRYMGVEFSQEGRITSLKSSVAQLDGLANGGVYLVNPRTLLDEKFDPGKKISLEDDIFPVALASGQRFFGVKFSGTFVDIGVPNDYYRAETLLAN
jgi:D-glycero-alpha-D-manno-heptose 1-phosphate guanylyltransferase